MNMQQMSYSERESRLKELRHGLDKIMCTAGTEDFDQEKLDSILEELEGLYPEVKKLAKSCDPEEGLKRFWEHYTKMERHRYSTFYNLVIHEEKRLKKLELANNYRNCKALAACYELQDYLAGVLAEYPEEY